MMNISKIEGALQELEESQYWFELLGEGGICIDIAPVKALMTEADELISILVASARTAKRSRPPAK